jgi:hypothetical protein
MRHMILATGVLIIMIAVFVICAICLFWPMEYTIDALIDGYPSGDVCGDVSEIRDTMISIPYFLAAAFIGAIILLFIWYFGYAHKFEYEQD